MRTSITRALMAFFLIFPTVVEGATRFFAHKNFAKDFLICCNQRTGNNLGRKEALKLFRTTRTLNLIQMTLPVVSRIKVTNIIH